jgi:hypothetical protein
LLVFSLGVLGDSDEQQFHDPFWNGFNEGCIGRDIITDIFWMDFPVELSHASFAFGYKPDTGNGPSFFVRLDSGDIRVSPEKRTKNVFIATSLDNKSCIVKTDYKQCPKAKEAYDLLSKATIPVASYFESPSRMAVMHYTEFYLYVRDGRGLENRWVQRSGDSPLPTYIEKASGLLQECSKPAFQQVVRKDNKNLNLESAKNASQIK